MHRRTFLRGGVALAASSASLSALVGVADAAEYGESTIASDLLGSIYVPRLRQQVWNMPVFDGVEDRHLNHGVGRITGSVGPGEWGNFAIAGHRTKAVRPFYFVERLRKNDPVVIRTPQAWFTYRLIAQQIVVPQASWVLDAAPLPADGGGASRLLTIVTCTPRGTTQKRWIWWGRLTAVHPANSRPSVIQ